jgi:integrase
LWILRSVLELARTDGAFLRNPTESVKVSTPPTKVGRALSDAELRQVLAAAEDVDPRLAAIVWTMAMAGLRIGEVLALKRGDVDLAAGMLQVAGSMSWREGLRRPKTKAGERTIPIPSALVERLRRHRDEGSVTSIEGLFFTASRGGPVRYDNWRSRTWARIIDRLDFDITPHHLRHTCATRLFREDGWTPAHVAALLGHADARMTLNTYTHLVPEELPRPSSVDTLLTQAPETVAT